MPYASKLDQARASRRHYEKNKAIAKARAKEHTHRTRIRNQRLVVGYLSKNPCVDCGEADPIVLEFDHVRGKKHGAISNLIYNVSPRRVLAEMKKCEVRCANCHRRKTAKDFGWYKGSADILDGTEGEQPGAQQVMFEDDMDV